MKFYLRNAKTGGTSGALDSLDGYTLADGDGALVVESTGFIFYRLDGNSSAIPDGSSVIAPLVNSGNKRWIETIAHEVSDYVAGLVDDAESHATAASQSASNASGSASSAATSASGAAASASEAATTLISVQQIFDNFDDRYLGAKATDPTVDNDGNPLVIGSVYYNTTDKVVKFYNGASWDAPSASALTSANNAANSATGAASSASAASGSASTASTKASEASTSATNASNSASAASTSAGTASTKASEASTSATNAANSASAASVSASGASTSAGTASTKASEASTSATNASNSASTSTTKASEASASATAAAGSASTATTKASEALQSANNAAEYAAQAAGNVFATPDAIRRVFVIEPYGAAWNESADAYQEVVMYRRSFGAAWNESTDSYTSNQN